MRCDDVKCEDGSVSHVAALLFGGRDDGYWSFIRVWLLGALLMPSVEFAFYVISPDIQLFWRVVGGGMVLVMFGLLGSLGGMKLALIISLLIELVFRCSKGRAWDAAYVMLFFLSRVVGIYVLLHKSQAHTV